MHRLTPNLPRYMAILSAGIIALMPFHAFMTVWLSSGLGHYTAHRLWKEVLLLLLFLGLAALFFTRPKLRRAFRSELLLPLMVLYVVFVVSLGAVAYVNHGVSLKAYAYGLLLDTRFMVFFVCTWAATLFSDVLLRRWKPLLLIPGAIVGVVAILQYSVLPADFLQHFGYGPKTIQPVDTIDQQSAYQRVQATLRGPNPLGAYMVFVLSAVTPLLIRAKKLRWLAVAAFILALSGLVLSFSRSAWLGAIASIAVAVWLLIPSGKIRRYLAVAAATACLAAGLTLYGLRGNDHVQNILLHTSHKSRSAESSNAGHASALRDGVKDIVNTPWGHGTGTAGPASVYNAANGGRVKIAENYYIQIGQEVGLLGLGIFIAINVLVVVRLWRRRGARLAIVLLASFVGIALVNMLSHAWADDTLSYIWWGLAGAACVLPQHVSYDDDK